MKFTAFVALRLTTVILRLPGAKLTKVLSSLGHDVLVQLHLDPSQLLPCLLMSVTIVGKTAFHADGHVSKTKKRRAPAACAG